MSFTHDFFADKKRSETDAEQLSALQSNADTLVFAGPGSGKTAVLTLKATIEAENLAGHRRIACITFTTEAANEMRKRIGRYLLESKEKIETGTIHSFCLFHIINPFAHLYLNQDDFPHNFLIASNIQKTTTFEFARNSIIGAERVTETEMNTERKKNVGGLSGIVPPTYDVALKVAQAYEHRLHSQGLIDFEDIVNYSVKILREQEYVKKYIESRFEWIFIDEYQDLGKPLHEIVLTLFVSTKIKFFIVGDINQSIFGFTGANPEYMQELKTFQGGRGFFEIELKSNYRSSSEIVAVSGEILGDSNRYTSKKLFAESHFEFIVCQNDWVDQMTAIRDVVIPQCDALGIKREEVGVLFPTNPLVDQCKSLLSEKNIASYKSRKGFERTRLILWFEEMAEWCAGNYLISLSSLFYEFTQKYQAIDDVINIAHFQQIIFEAKKYENLNAWLAYLIENLELAVPEQERVNFDNFKIEISGEEYKDFTISDFSQIGKPLGQVVLLTWHSAKGLEFDVVVLAGMSEDIMPRFDSLNDSAKLKEEERRCFVGVSRAKQICYLLRSERHSDRFGRFWQKNQSRYWTLIETAVNNYKNRK